MVPYGRNGTKLREVGTAMALPGYMFQDYLILAYYCRVEVIWIALDHLNDELDIPTPDEIKYL
jgi:hypothetical protein